MLERKIIVAIELSPEELEFEFCNMNDNMQAAFFNEIALITSKWERPFCFQLQYLVDNPVLTKEGRNIMEAIGQYGK